MIMTDPAPAADAAQAKAEADQEYERRKNLNINLCDAAENQQLDLVKLYLAEGANPEALDHAPLKMAMRVGHMGIIDAIVQSIFQPARWENKKAQDVVKKGQEIIALAAGTKILVDRETLMQNTLALLEEYALQVFHNVRRRGNQPMMAVKPSSSLKHL